MLPLKRPHQMECIVEQIIVRDGRELNDHLLKCPDFVGDEFEALKMTVTSSWISSMAGGPRIQVSWFLPSLAHFTMHSGRQCNPLLPCPSGVLKGTHLHEQRKVRVSVSA